MDIIKSQIKERILQYIDCKGITKQDFYRTAEVPPSSFKSVGLQSELSSETVGRIMSLYPDLNPDWVLNGKGEMLRDENKNRISEEGIPPYNQNDSLIMERTSLDRVLDALERRDALAKDQQDLAREQHQAYTRQVDDLIRIIKELLGTDFTDDEQRVAEQLKKREQDNRDLPK